MVDRRTMKRRSNLVFCFDEFQQTIAREKQLRMMILVRLSEWRNTKRNLEVVKATDLTEAVEL